jgi:flagellar basal body-associated protein FliL
MTPTPPETPGNIDRAAIDQAAQRTAEQAALRKVRKQLDVMEASDARQRRTIRIIAIVGIAAIAGVVLVMWLMLSSHRDSLRGAPVEIPRSAPKKG